MTSTTTAGAGRKPVKAPVRRQSSSVTSPGKGGGRTNGNGCSNMTYRVSCWINHWWSSILSAVSFSILRAQDTKSCFSPFGVASSADALTLSAASSAHVGMTSSTCCHNFDFGLGGAVVACSSSACKRPGSIENVRSITARL
eukprot:CAMPEP_0176031172 /NCGR_PEP_ID=MMETSP0120_2-20121206/15360_1 /TAXON_ID=160619 /ORGANISM="Kryptoperidinium foliaceum, Strain CCMP 1326" /LENGTH=141 /DNA_ID=CAMNT_0017364453 /DNA_START=103 /DNA_END=525 /DNA_ORIENTATION=-